MSDFWYMPEQVVDPCDANRRSPNIPGSYELLGEVGISCRHVDPTEVNADVDGFAQPLLEKLSYLHYDVACISPADLGPEKFTAMAELHFQEHLHNDDEARVILEGQGYFDIRDAADKWIRVLLKPGDCLILPAGLYHRFTTDQTRYIKTLRLFKDASHWIAFNRDAETEQKPVRKEYMQRLRAAADTAVGPADGRTIFSLRMPLSLDADLTSITRSLFEYASSRPFALMIFLVGSTDPTTGESWCPDCIPAKPHVAKRFEELRAKYGDAHAFFLQLPVERCSYLRNSEYPYRKHPTLQLSGVPTLLVLTPQEGRERSGG